MSQTLISGKGSICSNLQLRVGLQPSLPGSGALEMLVPAELLHFTGEINVVGLSPQQDTGGSYLLDT